MGRTTRGLHPLVGLFCMALATGGCSRATKSLQVPGLQGGRMTCVAGRVGTHVREYAVQALEQELRYAVEGAPEYVAVTEVYPDQKASATYRYSVSAPGLGTYVRCHTGKGFGPVTYCLPVTRQPVGEIVLRPQPGAGAATACVLSVRGVSAAERRELLAKDRFLIMGMALAHDAERREQQVRQLVAGLRERPELGISRGISAEIYYASRNREQVREQLRYWHETAQRHRLPLLLGMVSWWAGTPLRVPDGIGGFFGDVAYQQVCYAPELRFSEQPALRALLGERYTPHYTLTTPNQWSNTPWLTLNSERLNRYRYQRLGEAAALLDEVFAEEHGWMEGIFLENEPRYWDRQIDARHRNLWADFNPCTVEAARAEGVTLDPADGLSDEERLWLHRNVSRYNQETVEAMAEALGRRSGGVQVPLYTHALSYPSFDFPAQRLNHPPSDWAYARGARAGLEGILTQPSDVERVREWGRWSNLNREEGHGKWMHADLSLWDLRVAYLMGADLYNSYNWSEALFAYVDAFLAELPVARRPPAAATLAGACEIRLSTPMALQAFTRLELPVEVSSAYRGKLTLAVSQVPEPPPGTSNPVLAVRASSTDAERWHSMPLAVTLNPGTATLAFAFPMPAESRHDRLAQVRLLAEPPLAGTAGAVRLTERSAAGIMLSLDLQAQRSLSLWVIGQATDGALQPRVSQPALMSAQ